MADPDNLLSRYFRQESKSSSPSRLTDEDVQLLVENRLSGARLDRVLLRLAQSGEDRAWVSAVRRRISEMDRRGPRKPGPALRVWVYVWAAAAAAAFALSFVFPKYFMQCLAASVLAGIKAISDQRALKTQILIYRALEEPWQAPHRGNLQRDDAHL